MAIPKNKTVINIDDYTGFRWNGKHTSELGLTIVSSSSRYNLNPISTITNNTVDVPGGDGQYLFNSTYGPKKWTINFSFDNLDDYQWRELLRWLYHKDISGLVFDELPYKEYGAKLEGTPSVSYLCFDEDRVKKDDNSLDIETLKTVDWDSPAAASYITHKADGTNDYDTMYYKKRIYKGEGTLNFYAPFPYAYSARNYDGKYMKYLDEIEYFPDRANQETLSFPIGHTATIARGGKYTLQVDKINGTTVIDRNTGNIQRGALNNETSNGSFIIRYTKNNTSKIWTKFNTTTSNIVTLDNIGEIADSIEYHDGKYQLVKRVGNINLLNTNFKDILDTTEVENGLYEISLRELLGEENWAKLSFKWDNDNLQDNNIQNLDLLCNHLTFHNNSEEEIGTADFRVKKLIPSSLEEKGYLDINLQFEMSEETRERFKNLSQEDIAELGALTTSAGEFLYLFFPIEEEYYELIQTEEKGLLQLNFTDNILLNFRNSLGSTENLRYNTTFTLIPVLYSNFYEWKDSSGLRQSQTINSKEKYDECSLIKNTESTFGFRVYNGGDLETPFKLTFPVQNIEAKDADEEITIALATKKETETVSLIKNKKIENIVDLKFGTAYSKEERCDFGDFYYYFYKVSNYRKNMVDCINIQTGEIETFSLDDTPLYCRVKPEELLNVLKSFSIRFKNEDSLNSYAGIIKDYTAAAAEYGDKFNNTLEIDTNKHTINFIVTSALTGERTIIPCYFMMAHGEMFKIPPEVDNLYLLVYNQRKSSQSFIENDYKKIPDIQYRYLYL